MTINLGLRAHDIEPHTFTHLFEVLSQYQLNNIQFAPFKFLSKLQFPDTSIYSPGLMDTLSQKFAAHHISVSVLGCYVNIIDSDEEARQKNLLSFRDSLAVATRLKAGVVATETGSVSASGYTPANYTEAAYQDMLISVRQMVEDAEKFGVIVGIEPGVNHPLHDNLTVRRLLDDVNSPNLKVVFDLANLVSHDNVNRQAELLAEATALYGREIYAFHLKDFQFGSHSDGDKIYKPFGQGIVDVASYLNFMNKLKPYCYATFEGVHEADLPAALKIVKEFDCNITETLY